jgi:PKD repeat protein
LEHTFDSPGVYTVQLQVADSSNNKDSASVNVVVESTPPVASFECEVEDESSPGTLTCDASDSYDPDGDEISYLWDFDGEENVDFEYLDGQDTDAEVTVRFLEADSYDISMTVTDDHEGDLQKSDTYTEEYRITSVLKVAMALVGDSAKNLDSTGKIDVEIIGETTGEALEVDCGNSTSDFSDSLSSGRYTFTCTYDTAGIYSATMKAYDEDGASTSDTLRVYIGSGDDPIAVIDVDGNGEDIGFDGSTVYGNVDTKFTFDASNSVNIDGTQDTLTYSWNFGNGKTSSSKNVTTSYDEIAVYEVTLTVRDSSDNSISSETSINVDISPIPPEIRGITAIPQGDSLETPLKVTVTVDAVDDDGSIDYIKAWYYDLNDTAEPLGTVIAQSNEFSMTLNTNGDEGDEVTYGFAVEVTDSDNMTVSSENELESAEIPTLTVTNGPNDSPVAAFSVDRTSVFVGEEITFINESYDPDGDIVQSWWDIGADGSHNDDPVEGASSLTYTFSQVHTDGIEVRLKVEDSAGATDFSDSITIFVDTLADPPDARFLTNISGTTVTFTNNSDFDEENGASLQGVYWDFDLSVDSDGNGVPDDDFDSFDEDATWTYDELGTYQVSMTVVDTTGQMDVVTQDVNVIDAEDPIAAFSYTVNDRQVKYKNESMVDEENGVDVRSYAWDFDLDFDADEDGDPENDIDSTKKSPTVEYDEYGEYEVSLTVEDSFGKTDTIQQTVDVADPVQPVTAVLTSIPQPNSNGQIVLDGTEGEVTFFFSAEDGSGTFTYQFDKNIFFDTNKDGIRDNDIDYADEESGTWSTMFFESYGTIVVALTVTDDETGDTDTETVQVVFQGSMGSANLINATPQTMMFLVLSALLAAIGGVALVAFNPATKS